MDPFISTWRIGGGVEQPLWLSLTESKQTEQEFIRMNKSCNPAVVQQTMMQSLHVTASIS